ncbi:hypothetical protein LAU42_09090 [Macrococcus armenti]|uniref:hypothetical protein n=1 Tax=Macrococcus armenti TaxID=2875764 RepID=UPI001CC977D9|nr:hypothetical protein [Macrococcus armenti]UBH21919.1 hypothetical protein LAU42_09090 [Macrococcus armenti]
MTKYRFSVWNVLAPDKSVLQTFVSKETAERFVDEITSGMENDHGNFIAIKEVKVYGGNTNESN